MGLDCKIGIRKYANKRLETALKIEKIDNKYNSALLKKDFGKEDYNKISKINNKLGFKFLTTTKPDSLDLPGTIQINYTDKAYEYFNNVYGDGKLIKNSNQISNDQNILERNNNCK